MRSGESSDRRTVVVLVDYRGAFWSSTLTERTLASMDVPSLTAALVVLGLHPVVMGFDEVDLRLDWHDVPVIYTSTEDPGLQYKSYIEDVVLGLDRRGARLIPRFDLLRAHHNKVFMEILRSVLLPHDELSGTAVFGTLEEYRRSSRAPQPPIFVKSATGAGSAGVRFAADARSGTRGARELSRTGRGRHLLRTNAKRLLRPGYVPHSAHRGKFIVQPAITGLEGDFKVLRYGRRYFVLYRRNRADSPTASGAGRLEFDPTKFVDIDRLLAFGRGIADRIDTPFASLDIASSNGGFSVLEFQAIAFGPGALQWGTRCFLDDGTTFIPVSSSLTLEEVFAEAVAEALGIGASCDAG